MGILDIIFSIIGIAMIVGTLVLIFSGGGEIIPLVCGFGVPLLFALIGIERIADYFGVSSEFMLILLAGLFVGSGILATWESSFARVVSVAGSGSGMLLVGMMLMRFLPREWLVYIANHAAPIVGICFVPLLLVMIAFVFLVTG